MESAPTVSTAPAPSSRPCARRGTSR
jgi:hypothetical protein